MLPDKTCGFWIIAQTFTSLVFQEEKSLLGFWFLFFAQLDKPASYVTAKCVVVQRKTGVPFYCDLWENARRISLFLFLSVHYLCAHT